MRKRKYIEPNPALKKEQLVRYKIYLQSKYPTLEIDISDDERILINKLDNIAVNNGILRMLED